MIQTAFQQKVRITGTLVFDTAFHIGSGKEGDLATDMGVIKDEQGWPVLPGSTLKGCFRATAERLSTWLGISACLMDRSLSLIDCVGDQNYFKKTNDDYKKLSGENEKLKWLNDNTCQICRLFGSPLQASRIFFEDGRLDAWKGSYQIRDGVVIDRDSNTARPKLKYDYEATSKETEYGITIDLENPLEMELALTAAVISEWQAGFRLGGFTSRGLGRAKLDRVSVELVDFSQPDHLKAYLLNRKMQPTPDLLKNALENALNKSGGVSC